MALPEQNTSLLLLLLLSCWLQCQWSSSPLAHSLCMHYTFPRHALENKHILSCASKYHLWLSEVLGLISAQHGSNSHLLEAVTAKAVKKKTQNQNTHTQTKNKTTKTNQKNPNQQKNMLNVKCLLISQMEFPCSNLQTSLTIFS